MAGFTAQGEGGNTQGATENIYSVSNATSRTFGGHTLRFGLQAQFRKFEHLTDNSTRGNFTFNGNFTGNSVADYLLGYCSTCAGAFGASGATYNSPTIAPFIDDNWQVSDKLSLQLGLRWEYLAPWAEQNGVEAAFDAATGQDRVQRAADLDARGAGAARAPAGRIFPGRNPAEGFQQLRPSRRRGVQPDRPDGRAFRVRRVLRQPESERAAVHAPDSAVLRAILAESGRSPLRCRSTRSFPDLNNIPQFPAPFSLDPTNRTPYTMQWNVNVQRSLGRDYLVEAAYTGSRSRNLSKRYNINQADFGTTDINTRLPFPQFQPAMLYSAAIGTADFKGLSLRFEKRYSAGLFFLAQLSAVGESRQRFRRGRGERHRVQDRLRRRREPVAVSPAPSRRLQLRLRAAVRRGPPLG